MFVVVLFVVDVFDVVILLAVMLVVLLLAFVEFTVLLVMLLLVLLLVFVVTLLLFPFGHNAHNNVTLSIIGPYLFFFPDSNIPNDTKFIDVGFMHNYVVPVAPATNDTFYLNILYDV